MLEPRVRQELLDGLRAGREPDGSIVIDGPPRVALGLKPNPDGYPDPDNKVSGTGLRE